MSITQQAIAILNAEQSGYYRALIYSFSNFNDYDSYDIPTVQFKDYVIGLYLYLIRQHNKVEVLYWIDELMIAEEDKEWFVKLINDYNNIQQ